MLRFPQRLNKSIRADKRGCKGEVVLLMPLMIQDNSSRLLDASKHKGWLLKCKQSYMSND